MDNGTVREALFNVRADVTSRLLVAEDGEGEYQRSMAEGLRRLRDRLDKVDRTEDAIRDLYAQLRSEAVQKREANGFANQGSVVDFADWVATSLVADLIGYELLPAEMEEMLQSAKSARKTSVPQPQLF